MNEMQVFQNQQFGEVRVIEEDGKVLFCGNDVARALGYAVPRKALFDHCKGVLKRNAWVQTGTKADGSPAMRETEMSFIPESDLYRLSFSSKLPTAEVFTDWVVEEVLPSIRKNGGYLAGQDELSPAELMARALVVAQKTLADREERIARLTAQNKEMAPKALFADAVTASPTSILVGDLAKLLKQNGVDIGQQRLFNKLREDGYLMKQRGVSWNMPTQRSMEAGWFEIRENTVKTAAGVDKIVKTPLVTGKGQMYLMNKYAPVNNKTVR